MTELPLLVQLAATFFMVGVVWFSQAVHWPLFEKVDATGFPTDSRTHARLTGLVAGPPMPLESATAVAEIQPEGI